MATFVEALKAARAQSAEHQCTKYVACTIQVNMGTVEPTIKPDCYLVTDWLDGSCVARWDDGIRQW